MNLVFQTVERNCISIKVDAVVRVQKGEAQSLAQRLQQAQLTGDTSGPTQIA